MIVLHTLQDAKHTFSFTVVTLVFRPWYHTLFYSFKGIMIKFSRCNHVRIWLCKEPLLKTRTDIIFASFRKRYQIMYFFLKFGMKIILLELHQILEANIQHSICARILFPYYIAYTCDDDLYWILRDYFQSFGKGCQIIRMPNF